MSFKNRFIFFAMGMFCVLYGSGFWQRGVISYKNWQRQTLYSPAVIATGIFFIVLCFLPWDSVIKKFIESKLKKKSKHP